MGKTVLAARIAYQLRSHFPNGVLWARLDTSDTMSTLSAFASAYGRDVSTYIDVDSRGQVVREILANKRALVVLDNAQRSEEVTPLLPPTGACAVIITTRRRDLSATRGARRFNIGPFDRERLEALDLFATIVGKEKAQEDARELMEIADELGHLPLAVDIAASRLAHEPGWLATGFLKRVREEKQRLNELEYEDLSVRASFNVSYDDLNSGQQRSFAALGVFGGEDFGIEAVASVVEMPREEAQDILREFFGLSLVQQGRPGRYRLHPLLCDYAKERIADTNVFARMVDFFVQYAEVHEFDFSALSLEINNVLGALQVASAQGMYKALVRGANAAAYCLEARGLYATAEIHLQRARHAAESLGDVVAVAISLLHMGRIELRRGDYALAEKHYGEGLDMARKSGDNESTSFLLANLGWLLKNRGNLADAEECFREGLVLAREIGNRERVCTQLANLGVVAYNRGEYAYAEELYQQSLSQAQEMRNRERVSDLLINLGMVANRRGDYDRAENLFRRALSLAREIGHRWNISYVLAQMSEVAYNRGDYALADKLCQEGLMQAREIEQREVIAILLRHLGVLAETRGDYAQAEDRFQRALVLVRKMERIHVGPLLGNLGALAASRGEYGKAEKYLQEGTTLARDMENPWLIAHTLEGWAELYLRQGEFDSASEAFHEVLEVSEKAAIPAFVGNALHGLARVALAQGLIAQAQRQAQGSLAILHSIGHGDAAKVKKWLDDASELSSPG